MYCFIPTYPLLFPFVNHELLLIKNQHMENVFGWLGKFQALLDANGKGKIRHIYIWIIHYSLSGLVTLILIFMSHPQSPDYQK